MKHSVLIVTTLLALNGWTHAADFFCDFSAGLPDNAKVYGDARVESVAGVEDSGVLKLVTIGREQMGSFIIDPLDGTNAISGFEATFRAFIGGGNGACGFGFCLAPHLPQEAFSEDGWNGLAVTFDTFRDLAEDETVPGARVFLNRKVIARQPFQNLRQQRFVDVSIKLSPGGSLNVTYDGVQLFTNLIVKAPCFTGSFAMSARTGASWDDHFVDDLRITTQGVPTFLKSYLPIGDNAAPDAAIEIELQNISTQPTPKTIQLILDDSVVPATISTNRSKSVVIRYQPSELLEPGSSHLVQLVYSSWEDQLKTNTFTYGFAINPHIVLSK